jgi:cell division septal protein FtsQ
MARSRKNTTALSPWLLVGLPLLALGLSMFAIVRGVQGYLVTSDYFRVRTLKVQGLEDERYVDLIKGEVLGKNIFRIDVGSIADRIQRKYPTLTRVVVLRIWPSELMIKVQVRHPTAVVKRDLYYVLDDDGVALAASGSYEALGLPLIVGLEDKLSRLKVGGAVSLSVFGRPLALARILREQGRVWMAQIVIPELRRVSRIQALGGSPLAFQLGEGLVVKVGSDTSAERLALLGPVFRSLGPEISQVSYIDLRPREPVISMKETTKRKK